MKLNTFSLAIILGLPSSAFADQWSNDDWGQWLNEDLTKQEFSDDAFEQLNQLDGIETQRAPNNINGKKILPNEILFQLWQLEQGHQYLDMSQLSPEQKAQYMHWLDQSEYAIDDIETNPELDLIEPLNLEIENADSNEKQSPNILVPPAPSEDMQVEYQYETIRPQDLEFELENPNPQICDDPNHYHWGDNEFYYHDDYDKEHNK